MQRGSRNGTIELERTIAIARDTFSNQYFRLHLFHPNLPRARHGALARDRSSYELGESSCVLAARADTRTTRNRITGVERPNRAGAATLPTCARSTGLHAVMASTIPTARRRRPAKGASSSATAPTTPRHRANRRRRVQRGWVVRRSTCTPRAARWAAASAGCRAVSRPRAGRKASHGCVRR